jgi:hypothetical protein
MKDGRWFHVPGSFGRALWPAGKVALGATSGSWLGQGLLLAAAQGPAQCSGPPCTFGPFGVLALAPQVPGVHAAGPGFGFQAQRRLLSFEAPGSPRGIQAAGISRDRGLNRARGRRGRGGGWRLRGSLFIVELHAARRCAASQPGGPPAFPPPPPPTLRAWSVPSISAPRLGARTFVLSPQKSSLTRPDSRRGCGRSGEHTPQHLRVLFVEIGRGGLSASLCGLRRRSTCRSARTGRGSR